MLSLQRIRMALVLPQGTPHRARLCGAMGVSQTTVSRVRSGCQTSRVRSGCQTWSRLTAIAAFIGEVELEDVHRAGVARGRGHSSQD